MGGEGKGKGGNYIKLFFYDVEMEAFKINITTMPPARNSKKRLECCNLF